MWKDAVTNDTNKPVNRSAWNSAVKMRVIVWHGVRGFRAFDFANAGYEVRYLQNILRYDRLTTDVQITKRLAKDSRRDSLAKS